MGIKHCSTWFPKIVSIIEKTNYHFRVHVYLYLNVQNLELMGGYVKVKRIKDAIEGLIFPGFVCKVTLCHKDTTQSD